ncbi:hypothetical protein PVT68_02525 [Microbulbifer bruguierae]|uniref:DUF1353 domain-containing protein n=1 Tax=Microbulbifer bruguierae TaxID=3029061 RepID=A0ABY8NES5_9GAMM|nr:hypothetical protein [Microbulbifer bruguierae]WGL17185.1 hypothetical protein PVT68_02525 [Microbulbifer bruguierae]
MPSQDFMRQRMERRKKQFVENLNTGEFAGKFSLEWIGPGLFNYVPDPHDPFKYIRNLGNGESEIIEPGSMTTDGGSIPLLAQVLTGLEPWECGPAYIIHDWEFYRHDVDENFTKSFEDVNLTLAESMWTLMTKGYLGYEMPKKNYNDVHNVYFGVMSPVARSIWDA